MKLQKVFREHVGAVGAVDENSSLCPILRLEVAGKAVARQSRGKWKPGWPGWSPARLLPVSGPGVVHPAHEDRELVLLVPEQEEEGLPHLKDD